MSENKIMWWAYLHSNGTVQVKRWLGDIKDYTEDCEGNQFVVRVVKPYEANDREIAHRIANESLGIQGENNVSE